MLRTIAVMMLTLVACGSPCPPHSHEYQEHDAAGPSECQADPCWQPSGEWAADGYVPDPVCVDAGSAEGVER